MGINANVFSTLKGLDRPFLMKIACYLMFDEMYSERTCISIRSLAVLRGFEDVWSHIRQAVLHIILCSLHKEWKQPVVYYLIQRNTKGEMLINLLMPATLQDWKLLPPCVTWVPIMTRPWNVWVFLKICLSSGLELRNLAIFVPVHLRKCAYKVFLNCVVANAECDITVSGCSLMIHLHWRIYWNCMVLTNIVCIAYCPKWLRDTWNLVPRVHWKLTWLHKLWAALAAAANTLVTLDKDNCTVSLSDMLAYQQVVQLFV